MSQELRSLVSSHGFVWIIAIIQKRRLGVLFSNFPVSVVWQYAFILILPNVMNEKEEEPELNALDSVRRRSYLVKNGIAPASKFNLDELIPRNDDLRSIPNNFARSSLFTARSKKEPRAVMMEKQLFHLGDNVVIKFSGIELRTYDDELVWMQIIQYARSVPFGESFVVSLTTLLRDLGWPRNAAYYDKARACITRLRANVIIVQNTAAYGTSGTVSLIQDFISVNDNNGKPTTYSLSIHPNLIYLFAGNTFTNHRWAAYRSLSPIARRLADYAESHREPFPLDVEAFKMMCDSSDSSARGWRANVAKACKEVQETGIVVSAKLVKSKIVFNK